ncbi:MAG TPA: hypothetical protein VJ865_11490 [Gemmatimonadaceae bacterium]|nr:hypothetical protein [Gemmatimonadaceae bacterium]
MALNVFRARGVRIQIPTPEPIMTVVRILTLATCFLGASAPLLAQTPSESAARSSAIAASFSKFKSLKKEKRGITKEKYLSIRSEPAVLTNPAEYSGRYQNADFDFVLHLRVNADGTVSGDGHEPLDDNVNRTFTLTNGRIQGALLTARKVYANGATERFEGAFMNRTIKESPNDPGVKVFGFGTMSKSIIVHGMTIDKFFLEKTS